MESATGSGLREFLDWAGSKGELNQTTARALKGAVGKILLVEGDPENIDIRSLQVDDVLRRFETRFRTDYSPGSMSTYKTRFRQAVDMYLAWVDNDPRWQTVIKNRRVGDRSRKRASAANTPVVQPADAGSYALSDTEASAQNPSQLVRYTLPLRRNLLVQIELPVHLTRADADRIAVFVQSLAFDDVSDPDADESSKNDQNDDTGGD